jgi:hypothetical protein
MTKAKYFSVETETQMTDGSFKKVNHQFRNYDEANDFYEAALVGNKYHAVKLKGRDYSDVDIDTSKEDFDGEYLVLKQTNKEERKYELKGWMTEEDRDMGESESLGMFDSLQEAKRKADVAFYRQGYQAVEVLEYNPVGDDYVVYFLEEPNEEEEEEEYALGGMFKSRYNTGRSWHLDHARHNKKEDYEVPMDNRKGAKKTASSSAKRAKTSKYSKSSRAASSSSSSSSRGYDYIPNAKIKSITTTDGKVITSKKVLDGAYVRKKNGGMM